MNIQLLIVALCIVLAGAFIVGRTYRSVKKRGCNRACEKLGGTGVRKCQGGGECPNQRNLRELSRKNSG